MGKFGKKKEPFDVQKIKDRRWGSCPLRPIIPPKMSHDDNSIGGTKPDRRRSHDLEAEGSGADFFRSMVFYWSIKYRIVGGS